MTVEAQRAAIEEPNSVFMEPRMTALGERQRRYEYETKYGTLSLDVQSQTAVSPKTGQVYLTPTETALLEELMLDPKSIVSGIKLLSSMWKDTQWKNAPGAVDPEGEAHLIRVHISRLRKKLGPTDVIYTLPYQGYSLTDPQSPIEHLEM